ncbi:MAG: hypothetical protein HC923_12445 [Myxococcales bacterium]|nr:hypothetical protein [Myxococcales bacterium]
MDKMTNHDNPHNNYLYLLASIGVVGLAAYLWLLLRLLRVSFGAFRDPSRPLSDRAISFGIVTSFFSYAFYSIAGFDSIACSVFLFFMLGAASVLFQPNGDTEPERLSTAWARRFARRGQVGRYARPPSASSASSSAFARSTGRAGSIGPKPRWYATRGLERSRGASSSA